MLTTAYFDNAATTYPKPSCVYDYMNEFYGNFGGSYGRGQYAQARSAGSLVIDTRKRIGDLLHCPAKQAVFTPSATIALNLIISGLVKLGCKNIFISPFEHNAVTRVLHHYEREGAVAIHQIMVEKDLSYDLEKIKYQFDAIKPDLVIMSHASNVIGLISPVESVFALSKKFGAVNVVDMAQTAGLVDLNVGQEFIDFAVFAGHKTLLGPTGISGFIMKPDFDLPATLFGGTGFDSANQDMPDSLPERFEMGTQNIVGVAGLNASIKWIEQIGIDSLWKKEQENRERLLDIIGDYAFLKTVGISDNQKYVGIVSCLLDGISSDSAGMIFSERDVAVRTGLQCAPLAHHFLGTFPAGTIRFSVSCMTTNEDFEQLVNALDSIEEEY